MAKALSFLVKNAVANGHIYLTTYSSHLAAYDSGAADQMADASQDCREALEEVAYVAQHAVAGDGVVSVDLPLTFVIRAALAQAAVAIGPLWCVSAALPEIGKLVNMPRGTLVTPDQEARWEPLGKLIEDARLEVLKFMSLAFSVPPP